MDLQPDDIETLRARLEVERARAADDTATIAHQKLDIAELQRQLFGTRSERTVSILEQMELEAAATEDERAAEQAAA